MKTSQQHIHCVVKTADMMIGSELDFVRYSDCFPTDSLD